MCAIIDGSFSEHVSEVASVNCGQTFDVSEYVISQAVREEPPLRSGLIRERLRRLLLNVARLVPVE